MAQWTGKVIGGLIGMATLGPWGVAVGVLLGHQFDAQVLENRSRRPRLDAFSVGALFFRTTFQIMGYIAKADGRVSEQDIDAARAVMAELRLDGAQIQQAIGHFTSGKHPAFKFDAAIGELSSALYGRPDLVRIFVEIQVRAALAGSDLNAPSRALLQRLAQRLGLSLLELAHIEAVQRIRRGQYSQPELRPSGAQRLQEAYSILEATPQISNEELAKTYRRQLSRHHPDKLKANGLPDSMIEHAKQRTQQIIEAYERIREHRGI
ncbi:MAG TPA: co-chaperone DjlA [Steroidobacteraceae bacterium]|nr:co-chaperone DjlA [Steroidobacteraceae bacterium]